MRPKSLMVSLALGVSLFTVACSDETAPQRLERALTLSLQSPNTAQIGDSVILQLSIQNTSTDTVFVVDGCPPPEVTIRAHDGTVVWDSYNGEAINDCLSVGGLAPGATMVFNTVWHLQDNDGQPVAPGTFTASTSVDASPTSQGGMVSLSVGTSHPLVLTQ